MRERLSGRLSFVQPLSLLRRQGQVAASSIRCAPLASCWPLPQQLLPVSATGCALGDAVKEKALLDQLNAFAASTGDYTFKKADKVTKGEEPVDLEKAASNAAKAVRELADDADPTTATLTFDGSTNVVTKAVAVPTSGDNKWSKPAKAVYDAIAKDTTYTASTDKPYEVKINMATEEVKAKLDGDSAVKTHTFIIVVAPLKSALN